MIFSRDFLLINEFFVFCASLILFACQANIDGRNIQKAKKLFSEGKKITDSRISIQHEDSVKALELNKKAIEKFSAAYLADTTFEDAVLFASECTMYARDYENCIYWTSKLMHLDTSQRNVNFCANRIQYCTEHLNSRQKE